MVARPALRRLTAALAATVLVATGCGGSDDEPDAGEPEPTLAPAEPTEAPDPSPTPEPEPSATPTPRPQAPDGSGGSAVPTPTQGPVSGDPAFTAASKLTTIGLDELFFGDPVEFAAEVASTTWVGLPPEDQRPQCYTVQPASGPVGIYFTVMDGFIERVDITNPIITTRSGAGVGSTEADLVELFGDALEVEEIPGGRQITFVPSDSVDRAFRIIWVTDGSFVVSMRAGRTAIVTPWAPCG